MEEEEKDIETESEVIDETDGITEYAEEIKKKRQLRKEAEAEEKEKELRHLIGEIKKKTDDDESEETPITPEDEITVSDRVSTESSIHPCLREIDISDSQLKLVNPYTVYQIPNDPGLLPAFWILHDPPPIYSADGVQKFYDIVKHCGLRSISSLGKMLVNDQLNLQHYGLELSVIRAICEALEENPYVQTVNLKGNKLSSEVCKYLNNLLLKNTIITNLSLSGCQIGANGASRLSDAISTNTTLKTLDLSSCHIGNEGFEYIASALSDNQSLESVNLSDNHLDETCSENLHNLLSYSQFLTHLDLSWNSLYSSETWKALISGLRKNQTLNSLNLSWNGLNEHCVPYLHRLLVRSQSLEKLDLSWNRFTEKDAVSIATGLSKNRTLQELNLGNNPLRAQGALALIHAITPQVSPNSVLYLLDLENVWANKDVLQELEEIEKDKPWVVIKLGGILSNYKLVGPNVRRILLKRANYETMPRKHNHRYDFGHFVRSLTNKKILRAKFVELVQKFKLKLSTSLLNEIMNAFEGPQNTVDQELLKSIYFQEFPETTASLPKLNENKGNLNHKNK
ncbi:leucine-rich repeat-containing protein 74B-like [Cataglyphis hispanica]|uniref:leucine-rich repeat-containing protein 74B-like n=1 Tax=Cataglyphis hispanica TaxID=1086592 RepID=UPI0021801969|nr:leucine-rich repeat-containing protein 74B-like [Cataglyphis hispanica]